MFGHTVHLQRPVAGTRSYFKRLPKRHEGKKITSIHSHNHLQGQDETPASSTHFITRAVPHRRWRLTAPQTPHKEPSRCQSVANDMNKTIHESTTTHSKYSTSPPKAHEQNTVSESHENMSCLHFTLK